MNDPGNKKNSLSLEFNRLAFFLVLAIGAILRLYDLDRGLWPDEIHNWLNFSSRSFIQLTTRFLPAFNHIFHSILVWLVRHITGSQSEIIIRTPAVIFGILQIWITYKLAKLLYENEEIAVISACLIALSPVHIFFSQSARGYTMLVFFSTAALYLLLTANSQNKACSPITMERYPQKTAPCRPPDGSGGSSNLQNGSKFYNFLYIKKYWLGFAVCGALATYSIITGLHFLISLFIWYVPCTYWRMKRPQANNSQPSTIRLGIFFFCLSFLLIILLYLPVYNDILSYEGANILKGYDFQPLVNGPIKELYAYFTKGIGGFLVIFPIVGLLATFKLDKSIALLFILIFFIPFFFSYLSKTVPFARTLMFDLPLFYILTAYGSWILLKIAAQKTNIETTYYSLCFIIILGIFYGHHLIFVYFSGGKGGNYKKTAQYFKDIFQASNYSDLVITEWNHDWANSFYMGKELGECLKNIYLTGRLGNFYVITDRITAVSPMENIYGLNELQFMAIFGNQPRLNLEFPQDKMEFVKGFSTSKIFQMKPNNKVILPNMESLIDFGSKLHWTQLNKAHKSQMYIDTKNFFKGSNSIFFSSADQSSSNIIISHERFNMSIPENSIILLFYAQPPNDNGKATFYYADNSGKITQLRMVCINKMNSNNHIYQKGRNYWKINAQLYITQKEISNLGLLLMFTRQARYDDFLAFVLS